MMNRVKAFYNHIEIPDCRRETHPYIIRQFQTFNEIYHRWEDVAVDHRGDTLYLPRGMSLSQLEKFGQLEVIDQPNPYRKISMKLYSGPRPKQLKAIDFLIGAGPNTNSRVSSQIVLTAPPGFGKTYCAIAAIAHFRLRTLILCHRKNILDQWRSALIEHTDTTEDQILEIRGSDGILRVQKQGVPSSTRVILMTQQTLVFLSKREGWEGVGELIKRLEIGLKIVDEAHRHFRSTFLTDSVCNIKKNIYLSATMNRSSRQEDRVFQEAFRHIPKYGEHMIEEMRKHIIYIAVYYDSHPSYEEQLSMVNTLEFFDRNRFIDYQIEKGYIERAMVALYQKYFSRQEGRTMILSSKIASCDHFRDVMRAHFPDRSAESYHTEIEPEDKIRYMQEADILSSTPGSSGEGINMPKLRYLFMTEPFSSNVSAYQNPSRLREYAPGKFTFYVEFIDEGFERIKLWQKRRLKHFKRYFAEHRVVYYEDLMKGVYE